MINDLEYESKHSVRKLIQAGQDHKIPKELTDYKVGIEHMSVLLRQSIRDLEDTEYTEEKWDMSKALGLRQGSKVTWRNQRSNEDAMFNYKMTLN